MVVSIPVSHPDAPPRNGMVRGFYESIEMIREIPLADGDAETNPVEWLMVTRSDPGGGIPRFMVERNVPTSIVQDAVKFLDWACAKPEDQQAEATGHEDTLAVRPSHDQNRRPSFVETNGIGAGVGTSIADQTSGSIQRASHRAEAESTGASEGYMDQIRHSIEAYIPDAINPLARTISSTSSASSSSNSDSFASAEDFTPTRDGLPVDKDIPTPSTTSQTELPIIDDSPHGRKMQEIEEKKKFLKEKLEAAQSKQEADLANNSEKSQKELEKAAEKHSKEKKKQEDKFAKELRKLEERREKETRKLLLKQQKEADKNQLAKAQRERDEHKARVGILDEENKLLKQQIGELQRENTALVARLGKTDIGRDILRTVREEDMNGGRNRASSRSSGKSVSASARTKRGSGSEGSIGIGIGRASTEPVKP